MQFVAYDTGDRRLTVRIGSEERVHGDVPRWLADRIRTSPDPVRHYRYRVEPRPEQYPVIATRPRA